MRCMNKPTRLLYSTLCPSGLPSRALAAGAYFGLFSLVQKLVREGTDDVYAETFFGTPLQCAAKQGHCGVMELLLEQPLADANVGIPSMTPLVIAAYAGHENIVRMLTRPQYGWPEPEVLYEAILNAARGGHSRVLNILKEVKRSDTAKLPEQGILIEGALYGHEYVVQMALDNGADVNRESYEPRKGPALKRAAEGGHEGIVRLLLSKGAHQKVKSGGPLVAAVRRGFKSIVQVLLEDGAHDFSHSRFISEAGTGHSALHAAAKHGQADMVRFILDNGLDLKQHPEDGERAIVAAADHGYKTVVRILHEAGVNLGGPEKRWSPMFSAMRHGRDDIVRLFIELGAERIGLEKRGASRMERMVLANKRLGGVSPTKFQALGSEVKRRKL